ncbi:MAG: L-threonylcarbamoyladenylate synthase [Bacteroidota bacterium]
MSKLQEEVNKALATLRQGGIILYPTDTIWGIGCDATNEKAVQRILELKGRGAEKGLILLVENEGRILNHVKDAPSVAFDLIEYSQKPLTIVFDHATDVADSVKAPDGTVAIRVTKDEFCKKLAGALRKPLVSTSANLSGQPFPKQFDDVSDEIRQGVDYVVDLHRKEISNTPPSTVIRLRPNGEIRVLRA